MPSQKIFVGIPVLNRIDLLERCLDCVDLPADVLVVNNNTVDAGFYERLTALAGSRGLTLWHPEHNLGVAASWNLIVRLGWGWGHEVVFLGSNDTLLRPGTLAAAHERLLAAPEDEPLLHIHAWNFFALHTRAIPRVGWFDENFYPAYKEDQDYAYRCELAGVRHPDLRAPECGAEHLQSQTIRSDPEYETRNQSTHFAWNLPYYLSKWGGDRGEERFTTPFGRPDRDWRWWPDPGDSIRQRDWDRERRQGRSRD